MMDRRSQDFFSLQGISHKLLTTPLQFEEKNMNKLISYLVMLLVHETLGIVIDCRSNISLNKHILGGIVVFAF